MKFSPVVDLGPRATPLNFGDDPDPDEYSGSKSSPKLFVLLSVCLFVDRISRKLLDGFS